MKSLMNSRKNWASAWDSRQLGLQNRIPQLVGGFRKRIPQLVGDPWQLDMVTLTETQQRIQKKTNGEQSPILSLSKYSFLSQFDVVSH
jgi:hypothetical protein